MGLMTEAWPDLSGRIRNGIHTLPVRVYYEDTDAGGIVYHARYVVFCERARSDCLRLLGIHQSQLPDLHFVVRRMTCDFLKPARLDDMLEVETRFIELGGARVEIGQQVMLNGNTCFRAHVTVALVDGRGRPRRLPESLVEEFRALSKS
jgi:acyl-CoA thioester hydrolase